MTRPEAAGTPLDVPPGFLERMLALVEGFNSGTPPAAVAVADVEVAVDFTGAVQGFFARADGGELTVIAAGRGVEDLQGSTFPVQGSALAHLARSDLPTVEGDVEMLSPQLTERMRANGVRRFAACRVQALGRVTGMLVVVFTTSGPALSMEQLALMRTMAALAAGTLALAEVDEADRVYRATASHELRTPVTVVQGFASTLLDRWHQLDEEERLDEIRVIRRRTGDLGELIDGLSRRVQMDPHAVVVDARPLDLRASLDEIVAGLRGFSDHAVALSVAPDLPLVLADRTKVGVLLTELMTNAAKYSPQGGSIELTAGDDGAYAVIEVADRGVGVDSADVERVFGRFWRAPGDLVTGRGDGFGLYLVRRLVEAQGGWVSIRPREGGGTVVEVRLPVLGARPGEASSPR